MTHLEADRYGVEPSKHSQVIQGEKTLCLARERCGTDQTGAPNQGALHNRAIQRGEATAPPGQNKVPHSGSCHSGRTGQDYQTTVAVAPFPSIFPAFQPDHVGTG